MNDKLVGRHARRRPPAAPNRETAPAGNVSVIAAELNSARCKWCNDDLEHCHESLVLHSVGEPQCIDPDCVVANEAHHMVIMCSDFGCGCVHVMPDAAETA